MDAFRELTGRAADFGARIVVWPEASFHDDPRTQAYWPRIRSIARDFGCYLVVPYFTEAPGQDPARLPDLEGERFSTKFINEALLVSPEGEVVGAGAKDHPVSLLGETSVTRGTYPVFETPFGKVGIMICYDLNFTGTALMLARNGAEILCVPSNDWKEISQAQYVYSVFRAVESGVSLIKADTSYDSCIVAFDGRILEKAVSRFGGQAVLVANIPLRSRPPLSVTCGNTLGLMSLIAWTVMLVALPRAHRRTEQVCESQ